MTLPGGVVLDLFGSGGGAQVAAALTTDAEPVAVLASIPLSPALRSGGDTGSPVVIGVPADAAARAIVQAAERLVAAPRGLAGRSLPFRAR
jgi:ATP-binding protein involved in chromosome partitioning